MLNEEEKQKINYDKFLETADGILKVDRIVSYKLHFLYLLNKP